METKEPNPRRRAIVLSIVAVLAVLVVGYAALTSKPVAKASGSRPESTGATIGIGDPKLNFTDQEKAEVQALLDSGRVKRFQKDSHEAWVDPAVWKALDTKARERMALLFAAVDRDFDGTRQIVVKEAGTERTVAEYFAGNLRVVP